ncbi:hypothetical protein HPB52_022269 [Rhipicephalus sanguineus]|uniref:Uncharacterized protein n=1 Tax=Rhipicephalus sanguineus TaxID=34632 RepID=A0A9D4Q341_RHISA|nr:hypothetical protein HPB52_022269 [Rhipicephalus sanguineus]
MFSVASLADEDIVAAVTGTQDAQADSSSGDEDRLDEVAATRAYSGAEVAAAFGSIHRFCGDMESQLLLGPKRLFNRPSETLPREGDRAKV